jgi:alpha-galactosidase
MFGGHLPASDAWALSLITNARVLAVNQSSRGNHQLFHANGLAAWTAEDPATGAKYVAVFNLSDPAGKGPDPGLAVPVRLADLGIEGAAVVTDLWTGRPAGSAEGEFAPVVRYHGAGLYKLAPAKRGS